MELHYSILDPTGNITALVESPVEASKRPETAAKIMRLHPEVEQVGFLRPSGPDGIPALRMAGGEFCGNASMCAAVLHVMRNGFSGKVRLHVSGAAQPVEVQLLQRSEAVFCAELRMPPPIEIREREFAFEGIQAWLPLVRMEGISHLIVEGDCPFFALLHDRKRAECAVREFCAQLGAEGLGLLFLEGEGVERRMTPLVYIPGSGTVFWENSCASGSAAVGMHLAAKLHGDINVSLCEPGGTLHVTSCPAADKTLLRGNVRYLMDCSGK